MFIISYLHVQWNPFETTPWREANPSGEATWLCKSKQNCINFYPWQEVTLLQRPLFWCKRGGLTGAVPLYMFFQCQMMKRESSIGFLYFCVDVSPVNPVSHVLSLFHLISKQKTMLQCIKSKIIHRIFIKRYLFSLKKVWWFMKIRPPLLNKHSRYMCLPYFLNAVASVHSTVVQF